MQLVRMGNFTQVHIIGFSSVKSSFGLTLPGLKTRGFYIHRLAVRRQVCTLTGSAVAHGGNPQDRAASPIAQEGKSPVA
jgi:hypothetical protein